MSLFDKFRKKEELNTLSKKNLEESDLSSTYIYSSDNGLPPVSALDMMRINSIREEIKKHDYEFSEALKKINVYILPLEVNTQLRTVTDIARDMISSLHYCFEAKKRLNLISKDFLSSESHKKFMIQFTDGFIFDELEKFSSYSEEKLKEYSEFNYSAYFFAYILGLIDNLPKDPESCDEMQLCSLITKFNNFKELLNNCKLLDKEDVLYLSDVLALKSFSYVYKKDKNLPYDEKMKKYNSIQRNCSFHVLSYDFDSIMKK